MLKYKRSNKKKAFTLSELLIALGVIGVLTAILMPIIFNLSPDQNLLMAKRAFYTTETVISDLLNDSNCYPKILSRVGLDDGLGYARCDNYGGKNNSSKLSVDDAKEKLVTLFSDKLDLKGSINNGANKYVFTTKDGMKWTFLNFNFTANNADSDVLLMVDVNGDKGPNCGQYSASGQCSDKNRTTGFDRFTMKILARGKIQIIDCWAAMAAKIDKKLVGKEKVSQEEAELANCSLSASSNKIAILNGIEYKLIENFRYDPNDTSKYINAYVYADADGNYIYNERIYYLQPDGTYKTSDGFIYDSNLKLTGRITNGYEYELKGDVLLRAINNSTYQYQGTGSGKYKQIEDGKYYSTWENRIFDSEFNTLGRYKDKALTDYYEFKNGFFVKEETPGGNYIDTSKRVYVKDSDGYYVYNNIYYYDKDMNLVKKYLIKEGNFYEYKKDSDISVREIGDGVYKDFTGKTLTRNSDGYYIRSDGNVYDDEFIYIGNINN